MTSPASGESSQISTYVLRSEPYSKDGSLSCQRSKVILERPATFASNAGRLVKGPIFVFVFGIEPNCAADVIARLYR